MASYSQNAEDLRRASRIYLVDNKGNTHAIFEDCHNEANFFLSALFIGYKRFVSSQDSRSCVFKLSCSEYAFESVQQKGIVVGAMAAFDRLSRCHGLSVRHYEKAEDSDLLIDPVE